MRQASLLSCGRDHSAATMLTLGLREPRGLWILCEFTVGVHSSARSPQKETNPTVLSFS